MSAKIRDGAVGSEGQVALYFSILCSSPLCYHCSERADGMVSFPLDKGICLQR